MTEPYQVHQISVSDIHTIAVYEYGNPQGPVILHCHGGPGSKSKPSHAQRYDLEKYRVITFDQRGCGNSSPLGEVHENTTQHIIADIETIRKHLSIDSWFLGGSSWGTTVALLYAQAYPNFVCGLLLSSVYLADTNSEEWAFTSEKGIARIFPDLWEQKQKFCTQENISISDLASYVLEKLQSDNLESKQYFASVVANWESNLMNAFEDVSLTQPKDISDSEIAAIKISVHYEANDFFLKDNQIMNAASVIKDIPTLIIHGRYDLLCPLEQAHALHSALNQSEFVVLPTSNHAFTADGKIAQKMANNYFLEKYT